MFRFLKENKGFSLVFVLAVLFRFLPLFRYQFSYDELSALSRTYYSNWHDLLQYGAQIDAHPVLIQCFLFAWVKIAGYSEVWIKLPFLLFSLGSIVYAYLFCLKWFGKNPALLGAIIFSFSFIFVYYAPLARMYASGLFFSTAFLYYWFIVLFDETKTTRHFAWMAVFILLSALNSHIGCLFVLTAGLAGLFFVSKPGFLKYIIFCAIPVAFYLPHLSITLFQLGYGGIGASQGGWLAAPDRFVLFTLLKALLGTGYAWVFFTAGAIGCIMINYDLISKKAALLLMLFFLNYAIVRVYSVVKAPVFQYSVMLFSAPCFVYGLSSLFKNQSRWMSAFIWGMAVFLCFQTFYVKIFYGNCVKNQNETQYEAVRDLGKKHGASDVSAVFFDTEKMFVLQYEQKFKHKINYFVGTDTLVAGTKQFRHWLEGLSTRYLVLGNANPEQVAMSREFFPYIAGRMQSMTVNLCVLSKQPEDKKAEFFFKTIDSATYFNPGHYAFEADQPFVRSRGMSIGDPADSTDQFPFSAWAPLAKISSKEGQVILVTALIKSDGPAEDASLNISIADKKDSTLYFGGADLKSFYRPGLQGYNVYTYMYLGSEYRRWKRGRLSCFVWNRGKAKFVLSGFKVETIDYWPLKWSIWD